MWKHVYGNNEILNCYIFFAIGRKRYSCNHDQIGIQMRYIKTKCVTSIFVKFYLPRIIYLDNECLYVGFKNQTTQTKQIVFLKLNKNNRKYPPLTWLTDKKCLSRSDLFKFNLLVILSLLISKPNIHLKCTLYVMIYRTRVQMKYRHTLKNMHKAQL